MLTRRTGGLTEYIPTPQEKRDGLIRDHTLALLRNLHERVCLIERSLRLPDNLAQNFGQIWKQIEEGEAEAWRICSQTPPSG